MAAPDAARVSTVAAVLDGYSQMIRALTVEFALSITWADLGDATAGSYNGYDRTIIINQHGCLDTQYWFINQVWTFLRFGEDAVPTAQRGPHLRVVD